jgi:hypothetical protein
MARLKADMDRRAERIFRGDNPPLAGGTPTVGDWESMIARTKATAEAKRVATQEEQEQTLAARKALLRDQIAMLRARREAEERGEQGKGGEQQ